MRSTGRSTDQPAIPINIVLGDELSASLSAAVKSRLRTYAQRSRGQAFESDRPTHDRSAHRPQRPGHLITRGWLYDSGSASPHPGSMGRINFIAAVFRPTPYDVRIEGHTDNVPVHTDQFASNWKLSAARATRIYQGFCLPARTTGCRRIRRVSRCGGERHS